MRGRRFEDSSKSYKKNSTKPSAVSRQSHSCRLFSFAPSWTLNPIVPPSYHILSMAFMLHIRMAHFRLGILSFLSHDQLNSTHWISFTNVGRVFEVERQLQNGNVSKTRPEEAQQVCIALVDLSCNEEFLELVQSSILAALESMPKAARFGLVTFSTKVGADWVQASISKQDKYFYWANKQ